MSGDRDGADQARPARRLVLVPTVDDAPDMRADTIVVVLDTAWSPASDGRRDLVAVRPAVASVLERVDLFGDALARLDAWAEASGMPHRLVQDEFSLWYAMREELWHWIHERLLWRLVVAELCARFEPTELRVQGGDLALNDVLALLASESLSVVVDRVPDDRAPIDAPAERPRALDRALGRLRAWLEVPGKRRRKGQLARRGRVLEERIRTIAAGSPDRVLVISYSSVRQQVHGSTGDRAIDPNLGAVIERLRRDGPDPVVIGLGLDHRVDALWPEIEADPRLLPQSLLATRWHGSAQATPTIRDDLADALRGTDVPPLDLDGIDVSTDLMTEIRAFAAAWLVPTATLASRAENLIAALRPRAMLLTHEGIRAAWLVAARRASIPTFAVQHGMLYPTHPGYCHPRDETLVLPDCIYVYGEYERDVLLQHGGYRPEEVEVSGSPRIDLDTMGSRGTDAGTERAAVRREIGIRDSDRMLIVSTAHAPLLRRFHLMHMIERTLGGPLPGIHLVFKQHPGERDEGPYRALLEGLARAGGYEPPRMTVIRDADLFRLLRASDAHLGLHSTVLTDAVVVGIPNLIAIVQAYRDPLGYVAAGVARPVRDVQEVREALARPDPIDPGARQAFLDLHFRPGDASGRIAEGIRRAVQGDHARLTGQRGRIVAIIQARTGSTRLHGKVLLPLLGEPILTRVMRRVSRAATLDQVVLATTRLPDDDPICALAEAEGWPVVRGSETDLLDRYLQAARAHRASVIVRITSDCPLIDPAVIDETVEAFLAGDVDYASNTLPPATFPRGLDVEVISREALERAGREDHDPAWREHVTPYVYRHPEAFRLLRVPSTDDHADLRWSVDTPEDYELVARIYSALGRDDFSWREALAVVEANPAWASLNRHVVQKLIPPGERGA